MEQANNLNSTESYDKRIDTLFTRFTAIYGQLWLSAYQNEKVLSFAKKEWSKSLQRFDNQTVKEALEYFKESKHFPPSLPQFVERCKAMFQRRKPNSICREPRPQVDPEVVKKHIKEMLDKLNR